MLLVTSMALSLLCLRKNTFYFFLTFNKLIGWQLAIWNCCKPFFSLQYNSQLLYFWWLTLSTVFEVFPSPLSDIFPSRMFTKNSLYLIICPIHDWRLLFKISISNIYYFTLWKTSPFVNLSGHFIYNILLQHHVSNTFMTLSSLFPSVRVSDLQTAKLQIQFL
jgi:hypothetical protein